MLKKLLNDWKGKISIDGKRYTSVDACISAFKQLSTDTHIILHSNVKSANTSVVDTSNEKIQYLITVKKYMTEQATPSFDFMAKWNNNNPMPLRTMAGTIEKETRGMVYMKLHGQAEAVVRCMRCGRTLTNPVSQMYGIGPECITKVPFIMDLDMNDVDGIKKRLVDIVWEGWIIRSSIISKKLLKKRRKSEMTKTGRDEIVRILMERDGISKKEAENLIAECREALENGNYEAIQDYLGLEDDYIFGVLGY